MKKIKRHLSFTLRQREQDDVLVKKDNISPIFSKKNTEKHGEYQYLVHELVACGMSNILKKYSNDVLCLIYCM